MSNYGRYSPYNDAPRDLQNDAQDPQYSRANYKQVRNSNASTYNPISYHPESQVSLEELEKQRKKEKQLQYRDQLDQMMSKSNVRKQYEEDFDRRSPELKDYSREEYNNPNRGSIRVAQTENNDTFQQQDQIRDQLLSRIKLGYNRQNPNVLDKYQQIHLDKERERQDFERNVVDKAASRRMVEEDNRARSQWEQKKRLEQETHLSNKRALEARENEKRRQKALEANDAQNMIDSLAQFQMSDSKHKDHEKRLRQQNSHYLQEQIKEQTIRKKENVMATDPQRISNAGEFNKNYREGGDVERSPLVPSYSKINTANYDYNPNLNNNNSNFDENNNYYSKQNQNYSNASQNQYDLKASNQYQTPSIQEVPQQKISRGYGQPDFGSNARQDGRKIADRIRQGNGYNIISHEQR